MNIIITILSLPLIVYLLKLKNKEEHGSFLSLLITPLITFLSLIISVYGFSINTSLVSFFIIIFISFSLIGDVFNALKEDYLLYGLLYFAAAHIILIVALFINCDIGLSNLVIFVISMMLMAFLYTRFKPNLHGIMEKAVPGYMMLATISVILSVTTTSFLLKFGVILFYISDIILGIHLFWKNDEEEKEFLSKFVWPFYAVGVYAISISTLYNIL